MQEDPVKIYLKDNAKPYYVTTARPILFPILPKVKTELKCLEGDHIIEVTQPTDWCTSIVPVQKNNVWT